eukprot:g43524.t1
MHLSAVKSNVVTSERTVFNLADSDFDPSKPLDIWRIEKEDAPRFLKIMGVSSLERHDVVNYFEEMLKFNLLPKGCDPALCLGLVQAAYERERDSNFYEATLVSPRMSHQFPDTDLLEERLLLAAGTSEEQKRDRLVWWSKAQIGSIRERPKHKPDKKRTCYDFAKTASPTTCYDFANTASPMYDLRLGTMHVAVGFVDLAMLTQASFQTNNNQPGPLRWVGYEANPFNVAKTLVIAEMLSYPAATPVNVLQVWYASTWGESTRSIFREALNRVLEKSRSKDAEVAAYLLYWGKCSVPLQSARQGWLNDQVAIELALSRVGNWRKRKDRLALILYFLAGELEGGGPYGSIPMFCHPPHLSIQREQETNALATINFDVAHSREILRADRPNISYLILSYLILSYLILSHLILSYLISSYLILSYLILSFLILSHLILSYLILSYLISSYLILSYLILSYLSYLILSHLISYYLILSHLISSYLILSYLILSHLISSHVILSHLISSYLILSHLISSYLISSYLILSYLISSYLILSYLILSYLISSYLILSHLILSYLILSHLISSYLIVSHLISSYLILSHLISSYLILSHLISSYLILSHLISSYLILSHLISSYLILSHLILSYLILSYPILSYLILSYLILSYLIYLQLLGARASRPQYNIVEIATTILTEGIKTLMKHVREGKIVIQEITHARVMPGSPVLKGIAQLKPNTVSWSNVCDDLSAVDFHEMVRAVSRQDATGAVHFAHSLHWAAEVKGASVLDYPDPRERKELIQIARDLFIERRNKLLNATDLLLNKLLNATDLLLSPMTGHPANLDCCKSRCQERGCDKWTEWFFEQGGAPPMLVDIAYSIVSPIARNKNAPPQA